MVSERGWAVWLDGCSWGAGSKQPSRKTESEPKWVLISAEKSTPDGHWHKVCPSWEPRARSVQGSPGRSVLQDRLTGVSVPVPL